MCSGAMRTYLLELDALPDSSLVSMVPVGLNAKQSQLASAEGGNAVGVDHGPARHRPRRPGRRGCSPIHESMKDGKEALSTHDAAADPRDVRHRQGPGHAQAAAQDAGLRATAVQPHHQQRARAADDPLLNGAELLGTYPLSIPIDGMALNITCTSYDGNMGFGLTGCRRTVPHLQRLLTHLDDELAALEKAAGL